MVVWSFSFRLPHRRLSRHNNHNSSYHKMSVDQIVAEVESNFGPHEPRPFTISNADTVELPSRCYAARCCPIAILRDIHRGAIDRSSVIYAEDNTQYTPTCGRAKYGCARTRVYTAKERRMEPNRIMESSPPPRTYSTRLANGHTLVVLERTFDDTAVARGLQAETQHDDDEKRELHEETQHGAPRQLQNTQLYTPQLTVCDEEYTLFEVDEMTMLRDEIAALRQSNADKDGRIAELAGQRGLQTEVENRYTRDLLRTQTVSNLEIGGLKADLMAMYQTNLQLVETHAKSVAEVEQKLLTAENACRTMTEEAALGRLRLQELVEQCEQLTKEKTHNVDQTLLAAIQSNTLVNGQLLPQLEAVAHTMLLLKELN